MAGAVCETPYAQKLRYISTKSGGPDSFYSKKTLEEHINAERGINDILYMIFSVYNVLEMM